MRCHSLFWAQSTFLAVLTAFSSAPHLAGAQTQDAPLSAEERFTASLAEIKEAMKFRRWRDAEKIVRTILTDHSGADYVIPHLFGLKEDLRRAAFWKTVKEPEPDDLVSGELLQYGSSTGKIKIRYTAETLDDFQREGTTHIYAHPSHFSSSWSIEIEGPPSAIEKVTWFVMPAANQGYGVQFGRREEGSLYYTQHLVYRLRGQNTEKLGQGDPPERKGKKSTVKARIEVGKKSLRGTYDGKRAFEVPKEEEGYGSFVIIGGNGGESRIPACSVTLEGHIDLGWIGGLIDAAVADQRAAFDAQWQDPAEFSAWAVEDRTAEADLTWADLFERMKFSFQLTPPQEVLYERFQGLLGKGRRQAASTLKQLEELPQGALSPGALAFLRFHCAIDLDRPSLALEHLANLEAAPEEELDFKLLQALLLEQAGRLTDARIKLEELVKEHPESSLAHAQLAEVLLLEGYAGEARATILRGRAVLPVSANLRELEGKIVKAEKGPPWERVREENGKHFVVRFDGERTEARKAREVLDEAWERCATFFDTIPGAATAPNEPSVAYLFSGEASYLTYVRGVGDSSPENTLGIYSPLLKQVAAWNQANVEDLWSTLRHECVHRYLDLAVGHRIPRWLNEGLAQVFENCWQEDGKFVPGGIRPKYLEMFLSVDKLTPLEEFLRQSTEQFLAEVEVNYAQAWAFVHFLRFGSEADRAILDRCLAELHKGTDPQLALDLALEGIDVTDLQKRFHDWLQARVREHATGR